MSYINDLSLSFEQIIFMILIPIVLTYIFTGFVGLERQNVGKAAGLSSHVLVGIGATGIAILQRLMFEYQMAEAFTNPEGQRIIAQVVTGIGFIGAGAILKDRAHIRGITTAATLWYSAMVGLVLGSGYLILGSILGVFMVSLIIIRDFSRGFNPFKRQTKKIEPTRELSDDEYDE